MSLDKLEGAGEPPAEPPAQPLDALCPDQPSYGLHQAPGHTHAAGCGAEHCLKWLVSPCACYNSVLGEGLSESYLDCKYMPPAAPMLSEEVL